MLSKSLIVPLLEKMLADGTLHEYEVDTEAITPKAPIPFDFSSLLTLKAWIRLTPPYSSTLKANPLGGPAFNSHGRL